MLHGQILNTRASSGLEAQIVKEYYMEKTFPIDGRTDFYKWVLMTPNGIANGLDGKPMFFDEFNSEQAKRVLKALKNKRRHELRKLKPSVNMNHLMIDIETLGNKSNSVISSIAAVEFNIDTLETGKVFQVDIDLDSCVRLGLEMDVSTVMWWFKQNEEARNEFSNKDRKDISKALSMFSEFCNKDYEIWGNSARFDLGLIQNAYNKLNVEIPWDFRKERCVRTLLSLAPQAKDMVEKPDVPHKDINDCYYQIAYCQKAYSLLT